MFVTDRRDKRGRRIGYNWWREYIMAAYSPARESWEQRREGSEPAYGVAGAAHSGAGMHQLSDEEYRSLFPPPTLKQFLIACAGMNRPSEEDEAA